MPVRATRRLATPLLAAAVIASLASGACRRATAPAPRAAGLAAPEPARPAAAAASGYDFRPAERDAVQEFLRKNPDLRLATDADRRPSPDGTDVSSLYGVYHPYFVRGDANDDGVLDFVLAFVRRDSDRDSLEFSVAVFAGRGDGSFSAGPFLERDVSLADGDVSMDRDSVLVTPDVDEDATRRYRWDASRQRHMLVRDAADEPDSAPPAQT